MRHPDRDHHSAADREPLVQYEDLEQATGFTQISNAVLRCYPELSDGEKMTYAVLKSFAYVGPETFVGEETLARARDVTISTISRHLNRLIEVGLVRVRRRGQGKTNIWIITRIPRDKLEEYIHQWRPKLRVSNRQKDPPQKAQSQTSQKAQVKGMQNPQVKRSQDAQAEEEQPQEDEEEPQGRSSRPANDSPSTLRGSAHTTSQPGEIDADSVLSGIVENCEAVHRGFSTAVETVENLALLAAEYFAVPDEAPNITGYLRQYDYEIVKTALATVVTRLHEGHTIRKPVAYFYTVVRVMQAEHDASESEQERDESERQVIARNWARSLQREWPPDQVRAILLDTYHSEEFVDAIIDEIT